MMTPEDIKKALYVHGEENEGNSCKECPLDNHFRMDCSEMLCANALAYITQLEETIMLMKLQMRGDCGCCKHGRDGNMATCNKCLTMREYHPMWEYEGLPEVESHDKPV